MLANSFNEKGVRENHQNNEKRQKQCLLVLIRVRKTLFYLNSQTHGRPQNVEKSKFVEEKNGLIHEIAPALESA